MVSNRAYGDPSPKTLATAIAYVHIAQQTKGLHMSTISALMNLYDFADRRPHYRFTEETLALAVNTPLWKAYRWLTDNGYTLREMRRHDMRSIEFWNPDQERYAFTGRWGNVYLGDANEAAESGKTAKADKLYAKGQYWLDRYNRLAGNA